MRYITADIHGEFNMFLEMLEKINFSENDEMYILGDVVDRGPFPIKMLKYIMEHNNIHLIRGNHEEMMITSLKLYEEKFVSTISSRLWMRNGGFTTVDQFLDLPIEEQKEIYSFVKNTKLFEIIENNVLVHAGINMYRYNFKNREDLELYLKKMSKDYLLWERDMVRTPEYFIDDYHIWVGHTPTAKIHDSTDIYKTEGFTVVDGGACFIGGKLICVCLDNGDVFYVERKD